jgi:MoaA/NifB/PqqE/SkfB family radical SAM enzyme
LIAQIFDELGDYLYQCHIFGNGEPMLDWETTRAIIVEAGRRKIFTLVSSNCTIMTPEVAREVVTSGLDHMVCAIDGVSQKAYGQYRVGGNAEDALAGMGMLVEARRETGSRMNIEWQYLVHTHNVHEVEEARALADELGVYLRLSPMGGFEDVETAREWLPSEERWRDAQPKKAPRRDFHCYWLWRGIVVNSNGQLGRCPGESNVHQLGSIRDGSIMSIYNGPTSQRSRRLFSKRPVTDVDFPSPCRTCNYFNRRNGPGINEPPVRPRSETARVKLHVVS